MTDRYNQVEDELTEVTTDLFLSHIRYKSPRQFPDKNQENYFWDNLKMFETNHNHPSNGWFVLGL